MEISSSLSLSSLFGTPLVPGGTTTGGVAAAVSARAAFFGPPAQVSLGEGVPTVTGFHDYTKLGSAGVWQFNLSAVLDPPRTGVSPAARSAEQQKADEAAVKQAFELIDAHKYEDARKLMNDLLAEDRTNAAAVHALGYADLSEGNYQQAEGLFLKAHALNPSVGYDKDARNARILQGDDAGVLSRARAMVRTPAQRDDGIRILISLTERSPENSEAHLLLGDALLDAGDGSNGLMQYSAAIRDADGGLLTQLETRLKKLAEDAPRASFVRQLLGKTYLRQGRFETALQTLTSAKALSDNPTIFDQDLAEAYVSIGRQQLQRGDVNAAMLSFQQAKDVDPTGRATKLAVAEGLVARAEKYARQGDYTAAASDYSRVVDILGQPAAGSKALRQSAARGAYAVGRALMNRRIAAGEDIGAELVAFQAAYDLDRNNQTYKKRLAEARSAKGDELAADGRYKDAAYSYQRAWQLCKGDQTYRDKAIDAFIAYADDRLYNLNYTDAIVAYREAYKINTADQATKQKLADAYNARGLDHMDQKLWAKAAADFREALVLFPNNAQYQHNYSLVSPWDPYA